MIDPISERVVPSIPFMTGQFKDEHPLFSVETALAEYAAANAAKRQVVATPPVISQIVADPPFVPEFRKATGTDGVISWSLNSTYFATKETAQWIADKFGAGEVVEVPFSGNGGIFASDAKELHVKLRDGRLVNAGLLAAYYERNPPDKFPGLAELLIRNVLGS